MAEETIPTEQVQQEPAFIGADAFAAILEKSKTDSEATETVAPEQTEAAEPAAQTEPAKTEVAEEPKSPTVEPEKTEPAKVETDWTEAVKGKSVKEVLAAMGVDEKLASLLEAAKTKEGVKPWLDAYSKDYTQMDAKELLRYKVNADYSGTEDPEELELMYQDALEQYKLDPEAFTDEEVRKGNIKLRNDVKAIREQLMKEQSERLISSKDDSEQIAQQQLAAQQERESKTKTNQDFVRNSEPLKKMLAEKKLTIGEGADAYHLPIDNPQALAEALVNYHHADSVVKDDKGNAVDQTNNLLLMAIAQDPKKFVKDVLAQGRTIEKKEGILKMENVGTSAATQPTPDNGPTDIYAAMAKHGKIVRA